MLFDLPREEASKIKIIGVGGGGSNAVNHMFKQGIVGVDYCICNTDAQAMQISPVPNKIQLGFGLTEGCGAGSKPDVGKRAAIESIEDVKAFLDNGTKMVFITAGMGGGTGTGAAPIIAKAAMDMNVLTVGIVTLPFSFEGRTRVNNGLEGLEELRKNVDCLVVIGNDKLRQIHGNLTISQAFSQADNVLCTAAKGIAEIITIPGYVNVDFEDVNTTMRQSGVAIMGAAAAEGEHRARRAVDEALNSPLLEDNNIAGAQKILVNITSGAKEASMDEIFEITEFIQQEAGQDANLIWGNCYDERLGEKLSVTIIATGFEASTRKPVKPTSDKFKIDVQSRKTVHLDEEVKKSVPSLSDITAGMTQEMTITEEKAANTVEFEFDNIRHTVEKIRQGNKSEPYGGTDISPEERRKRIEEMSRRREAARNRQLNVPRLGNSQTVVDLENQPAYLRKQVNLDHNLHSDDQSMSSWVVSIEDEQEPEIRTNGNSFLHGSVD